MLPVTPWRPVESYKNAPGFHGASLDANTVIYTAVADKGVRNIWGSTSPMTYKAHTIINYANTVPAPACLPRARSKSGSGEAKKRLNTIHGVRRRKSIALSRCIDPPIFSNEDN